MKTLLLLLVLSMVAVAREVTAQDAQCIRERAAMIETIRAYAPSDASVLGQQGLSERVLEAMGQTKRHLFTPERSCSIAYADRPIPIGLGQTMSQPFIVALMTQLAGVAPDHVVLEVGTGSGYQAAILAHLARTVCTIEIIPSLAGAAAKALRDLAYDNVSVRLGDGYDGWPECGPFDTIVVTAALGQLPPPLGLIELNEDQWFDPHASGLKVLPHDVAIKNREALRDGILTVKKAQAVFITLGMTESWLDKSTGMVMNQNPGAAFLRKFGDRFEFIDYSFSEVLKEMHDFNRPSSARVQPCAGSPVSPPLEPGWFQARIDLTCARYTLGGGALQQRKAEPGAILRSYSAGASIAAGSDRRRSRSISR